MPRRSASAAAGETPRSTPSLPPQGKPLAFRLTPGQAADCRAAEALLNSLPARCIVHADRAYDTNRIRDRIEQQGAVPNIPPKANRRWKSCFSRSLYKGRNAIERMFCRLKDCRRLATRYDRTAAVFLGSIHLAASVMWFVSHDPRVQPESW
jgi:transposase